ncbi:MAG TPA: peptide ligase PGM1-related protein [Vicinamibacteria bacterium]|nr:peptide ligase PGM1-related protein [Vicinamibacteria bacterium]
MIPEAVAFDRLKPRLAALWSEVFPRDDEPYTCVVIPSITLDAAELEREPAALRYEETLLFFLIRLRNPRARLVYVTSEPIPPAILEYYLQFLAGIPATHAASRLTMLSAHDPSRRPLVEKILERPRLVERIRAAIRDPARAYMTVLRSTALERRLAIALDIPMNAADPGMDALCTKSGARRVLREADVPVPLGREDLRSEEELLDALAWLARERPGLERAVLKLDTSVWERGHALVELPKRAGIRPLRGALRHPTFSTPGTSSREYLSRFAATGGVAEEFLGPGPRAHASVQVRIDPLGRVTLTSTHDELRGGPAGLSAVGCRFPASDEYRPFLQDAGLRVGRVLARKGLVSRLSVEFVFCRDAEGRLARVAATEVNLGFGGSTHPLLAVRFLTGGGVDPGSGMFVSPTGRPKFYRATDRLQSPAYRRLVPEDLIEILTLQRLHYSPRNESGALFYLLRSVSELGQLGLLAIGNSRDEAEEVFRHTVAVLDREAEAQPELP